MRSVGHAGLPVGATIASRRSLVMTASIPSVLDRARHVVNALRYATDVRGPFVAALIRISCSKYGISRSRSRVLNAMRSFSECTRADGPRDARYLFKSVLNS